MKILIQIFLHQKMKIDLFGFLKYLLYIPFINNLELGLTSKVFLLTVKNHINFLTELLKINFVIKYPFPFFSLFSKY